MVLIILDLPKAKDRSKKNIITFILLISYVFLSHVVIDFSGQYEIGGPHYRKLFFSFAGLDFVIGLYGYLKEAYFPFLIENIEENYPKFFLCGLICLIIETIVWDANDSIFFWIVVLFALTAPKENLTLNSKPKSSNQ